MALGFLKIICKFTGHCYSTSYRCDMCGIRLEDTVDYANELEKVNKEFPMVGV